MTDRGEKIEKEYTMCSFDHFFNLFSQLHPAYLLEKSQIDSIFLPSLSDDLSDIEKITKFTTQLNDGHTNIEIPFSSTTKCINAIGKWKNEILLVTEAHGKELKVHDEILEIEGKSVAEYLQFLSSQIPHENKYLLNSRSCKYPYENYNFFSAANLWRFVNKKTDCINFTILRNGVRLNIEEPITHYDKTLQFVDDIKSNTFYFTPENIGVLLLYSCSYDDYTRNLLHDFFTLAKANNTSQIILDLSQNMGGNSNLIIEFLKYINIDKYKGYHVLERKDDEFICLQNREKYIYNNCDSANSYKGEIFCNIGNDTFSSARMFATILKDNNIAIITGEPCGGKPSSYGAPHKFNIIDQQVRCRISTRLFLRPNSKRDSEKTLIPDISVTDSEIHKLIKTIK